MDNFNFLFAAFAIVWGLIFLYVTVLSRRNRGLEREIEELREMLDRRQG